MKHRDFADTVISGAALRRIGRVGQRRRLRPPARWRRLSTLHWALLVSVVVHAALLTVRFVDPKGFNRMFRDTPLEVILVNARSSEVPAQAQAIAQASLAGGGEADKGRATSPLPLAATTELGDASEEARRRIDQLQQEQQQLLAQLRRELAALPPPDPRRDSSDEQQREQEEHRRQLLRMLAEIEKRVNEENARPKKRYISPATREEVYALYYDALRRRIEERGTRDFPEHQGRKLYGELIMNVTVDDLGRVVDAEVVRPSRSRILDAQALAIVRAAAPFGPFSGAMRAQADQIVVTSRFRFTREEGFATSLTSGSR
jgi:protein TonB